MEDDISKDYDRSQMEIGGNKVVADPPPDDQNESASQPEEKVETPSSAPSTETPDSSQPGDSSGEPTQHPEPDKSQEGAGEGAAAGGKEPPTGGGDESEESKTVEVFNSHLSKVTDGDLKTVEDFQGFVTKHNSLVNDNKNFSEQIESLQKQIKELPKFKDERAKKAYEMIQKMPGDDVDSAKRFFHVQSLDLDKLSEKQIQFEAFLLETHNQDLHYDEAVTIFNANYEKLYGEVDFDEDVLAKREHTVATNSAKEKIHQIKEEYEKTPGPEQDLPTEEDRNEVRKSVKETLEGYTGSKIVMKDEENANQFDVEIKLNDDELKELQECMSAPDIWFADNFIKQFRGDNGFNYSSYADEFTRLVFSKKIEQKVFTEGINQGMALQIKKSKNAAAPEQLSTAGESPEEEKTFQETFHDAVKEHREKFKNDN